MEILLSILSVIAMVEQVDTLRSSVVSTDAKQTIAVGKLASPVSSIFLQDIQQQGLKSPKDLSLIVPNLMIPDYGSSMTSTIYLRGFGSRIDNPVVGLYLDGIPVIDKNNYDLDLLDIRQISVTRGPQGTLYGRNSMVGVLELTTLSPGDIKGGSATIEYGSANSLSAKGSWYGDKWGVVAGYRHSDGFYTNTFDDAKCDGYDALSARIKYKTEKKSYTFKNSLSINAMNQGGYPYRRLDGDVLLPVNYNDTCGYKRLSIIDGANFVFDTEKYSMLSMSSVQLLFDKMMLDQDFMPESIFTLKQIQNQAVFTEEFIIRPKQSPTWWNRQTGTFILYKYNSMAAPVRFKKDGIKSLILDNANAGIPDSFGTLGISEDNFLINSDFGIHIYNVALYHESYFELGRWTFTAGLRLDHEGSFMKYDNDCAIHYTLEPLMTKPRPFSIDYSGNVNNFYWELLPKAAAVYQLKDDDSPWNLTLSGTVSRGYKSGGFNTQIFSDIIQSQMMTGMMNDLGVHIDGIGEGVGAHNTTYKPETSTDYEIGAKFYKSTNGHRITAGVNAFLIDCTNQQITVFPAGKSTGRMMTNAGKSRSKGFEAEASWEYEGWSVNGSFGFTDARFIAFFDGNNDFSGNRIPYSPKSTAHLRAEKAFRFNSGLFKMLNLGVDASHVGRTTWNEDNSQEQEAYHLFGADASATLGDFTLFCRADNLSGTEYSTFYFKSMGNEFFQRSKPARLRIGLTLIF